MTTKDLDGLTNARAVWIFTTGDAAPLLRPCEPDEETAGELSARVRDRFRHADTRPATQFVAKTPAGPNSKRPGARPFLTATRLLASLAAMGVRSKCGFIARNAGLVTRENLSTVWWSNTTVSNSIALQTRAMPACRRLMAAAPGGDDHRAGPHGV